jgi:hypothetical protein
MKNDTPLNVSVHGLDKMSKVKTQRNRIPGQSQHDVPEDEQWPARYERHLPKQIHKEKSKRLVFQQTLT